MTGSPRTFCYYTEIVTHDGPYVTGVIDTPVATRAADIVLQSVLRNIRGCRRAILSIDVFALLVDPLFICTQLLVVLSLKLEYSRGSRKARVKLARKL